MDNIPDLDALLETMQDGRRIVYALCRFTMDGLIFLRPEGMEKWSEGQSTWGEKLPHVWDSQAEAETVQRLFGGHVIEIITDKVTVGAYADNVARITGTTLTVALAQKNRQCP